jgi:hypothetical protein
MYLLNVIQIFPIQPLCGTGMYLCTYVDPCSLNELTSFCGDSISISLIFQRGAGDACREGMYNQCIFPKSKHIDKNCKVALALRSSNPPPEQMIPGSSTANE